MRAVMVRQGKADGSAVVGKRREPRVAGISNERIRIRMEAYDHTILDQSAKDIVDTAKRTEADCPRTDSASHPNRAYTVLAEARTSTRSRGSSSRFGRASG